MISIASLDAVRLKVHRAQEHAEALHAAIDNFYWRGSYDASVHLDSEASELVVSMIVREEPPRQLGPQLGDFVHNLRSALDHLAIALVLRNKPTANIDRTGFPIFTKDPYRANAPAADKKRWRGLVKGMAPDHVAAIKAVQPYNNPTTNFALRDTLAVLATLSNTDKHKGLIPLGGLAGGKVTLIPRQAKGWQLATTTTEVPTGAIADGTEIARFHVIPLEANPEMDVDVGAQVEIGVTLETGVPPGTTIDQVLRFSLSRVLDIVNDFEHKFFA